MCAAASCLILLLDAFPGINALKVVVDNARFSRSVPTNQLFKIMELNERKKNCPLMTQFKRNPFSYSFTIKSNQLNLKLFLR